MLVLTRYKDNTYSWVKDDKNGVYNLSRAEAIAHGYWNYKIPKAEIMIGFEFTDRYDYDIIIFEPTSKLLVDIKRIDYK